MSQTGVIFWALFVGFVVYVTIKGRLPFYINVLWATVPASNSGNPASTTLQTGPSSMAPGQQNPYFSTPNIPLQPGVEPPFTGGGNGQF